MAAMDMVRTFVEYHIAMTRRVWGSIDQLGERDFLADDSYSRGSIRNLMVHLCHTDLRWLTGLKSLPDPSRSMRGYEEYPDRLAVRSYWQSVAEQLADYVNSMDDKALNENPEAIPSPRWEVLLHLVNHGTDHRSTILQKLQRCGAPTFDQDLILWLWERH